MATETRQVVIWGAGGFSGGELLRLVLGHPHLELVGALSGTHAGRPIGDLHPGLAPHTDLAFTAPADWAWDRLRDGAWTLFAALPHRATMQQLPAVLTDLQDADVRVVDLSGDFRLDDAAAYEAAYGEAHAAPEWLDRFVYGLPELQRDKIRGARYVANPGCLATGAQLALLPAAAAGVEITAVAVDGKTGSSGAGVSLRETTHHPRRMNNFRAYRMLDHQHEPELRLGWARAGGTADVPLTFVPQMAPIVRGIFTTAHLFLADAVDLDAVTGWCRGYYADAPFVRLVDGSPSVTAVWGTNRCDLGLAVKGRTVVVMTAVDNLVKGAAGQAVQNANLQQGWDETVGLLAPPPTLV